MLLSLHSSLMQRNSLDHLPSPPDTFAVFLPFSHCLSHKQRLQRSACSPPHTESSPRCTFVVPMDEREVIWRTWILQRGGVYPIKRRNMCLSVHRAQRIVLFLPSLQKDQPADGVWCWPWGFLCHVTVTQEAEDPPWGGTPYIRDFICQCALLNASPKQKHRREVCIKKAAPLDSCAAPAIWVMEGCRKLSPFSLLRNTNVEKMQGPLWSRVKRYKENYESHRHTRQSGPSYSNSYLHQTLHYCNHWFQLLELLSHHSLYITWSMHRIKYKRWLVPLSASAIIL